MSVLIYKINTMISIVIILFLLNQNQLISDYSFTGGGKSYQIIETKTTWSSAATDALSRGGYLVHINSSTEQSLIWTAITTGAQISTTYTVVNDGGGIAYIWIGANDLSTEGTWVWDGDNTGASTNFWTGEGSNGNNNGQVINSSYINWGGMLQYSSPKEPDDYGSNQDAAAIALEPWPKNNGSLGKAGEWNDISATNAIYYIIEYDFDSKPSVPTKPTGNSSECQGTNTTVFQTVSVANTQSYKWLVSPTTAGSFSGETTTGTISWNSNFSGTADITVVAVNHLGESAASEKLTVTVKPKPTMNEKPNGPNQLCEKPTNSTYTIVGVPLATTYTWSVKPPTAGVITGTDKTATLNWSDAFVGEAIVYVVGNNECGSGKNTDSLKVFIAKKPSKPTKPQGKTQLFHNDSTQTYTTNIITNAIKYIWTVEPTTAGNITTNVNNLTIDWDESFTGDVKIKVQADNNCGLSESSDELNVSVSNKPAIPIKPVGETQICQGTKMSDYSTEECVGSKSFTWTIYPAEAGSINSSIKVVSVIWSPTFSGIAKLYVAAIGLYANGDNSDTLEITLKPKPGKCAKPTGVNNICQNEQSVDFEVSEIDNSTSYLWEVVPTEAGEITGTTKKVIFNLNKSFSGKFEVSVKSVNECGEGEASPALSVEVKTKPAAPSLPQGTNQVVTGTLKVNYTTEKVDNATEYKWQVEPNNAAELTQELNQVTVNWSKAFIGTAYLSVRAINDCGESDFSEKFAVEVKDSSAVSIFDNDNSQISLFPIPAIDKLNVKFNGLIHPKIIKIYDNFGRIVKEINVEPNQFYISITTTDLEVGAFNFVFEYQNEMVNRKVIVIK